MPEPEPFKFCPYDGSTLRLRKVDEIELPACDLCDFVNYQNPRPCVAVIIYNDQRDILLTRRAIKPEKHRWDFPGGFIAPGETAEEAAIREVAEETELDVRIVRYVGSVPDVYGKGGVPTLNFCFAAEITGGTPYPRSDVAELLWLSNDQAHSVRELPFHLSFTNIPRRALVDNERIPPVGPKLRRSCCA